MRLRVFFADKGDCLLLTSTDGKNVLVDGGPKQPTFHQRTAATLKKIAKTDSGQQLDLVMVSHIDEDHINGILGLVKRFLAWRQHDFDVDPDGGNLPNAPKPNFDRPPEIVEMWHNSWKQHLGAMASKVSAVVSQAAQSLANDVDPQDDPAVRAELVEIVTALAQSTTQASQLQTLVDTDPSPILRNEGFDDNLITLTAPPASRELGSLTLTLLGPTEERLNLLREEWRAKLGLPAPGGPGGGGGLGLDVDAVDAVDVTPAASTLVETVIQHITDGAVGDVGPITKANRASLIVLVQAGEPGTQDGRSCLLTGDATHLEIIAGLEQADLLADDEPFWCDVLKVQHHGAEGNMDATFAQRVLAEHYVFCANGEHQNPDPRIVDIVIRERARKAPDVPFTVWFNCPVENAPDDHRDDMRNALNAAVAAAAAAKTETGKAKLVTVRVLRPGKDFFDICLCPEDIDCDCVSASSRTTRLTAPIP